MKYACQLFFIIVNIGISYYQVEAKILQGQLITNETWAFLARFCLLSLKGRFRYEFFIGGPPNTSPNVNLLLYYDGERQWPSIYPSNKTCEEKLSILSADDGQIVPLLTNSIYTKVAGCVQLHDDPWVKIKCTSFREFRSQRPRWWFIAIADCSSRIGLNVTYQISLTNGLPGTFWREHFSADEFGLLPILIAAICVYVILLSISIYMAVQLRLRRLLHVTYKIYMISMICQLVGISFEIYSLTTRGKTGFDAPRSALIGQLCEVFGENFYTLLLFLLALGYTVTKSILTNKQMWAVFWLVSLSIIMQILLFAYQSEVFDPGLVLYIYESPPGYALICIKIVAWGIFMFCCYKTSRKSDTKLHFYVSMVSLGSAWFLCHPLTVLIITFAIDKWVRESVAKGCYLWIVFIGHAFFLYITRPASSNERFPFHIRTCQVLPIAVSQNHYYEPRRTNTAAIFTVEFRNDHRATPS